MRAFRAFRMERLKEEDGVTLVEMLVTLFIFAIITTLMFSTVMSGTSNLKTVRQNTDLNEESRLVLNRMSRELRQASEIVSVINPDGPGFNPNADTSITFKVDFNGDGSFNTNPAFDVEVLTYHYDRANSRLLLETPMSAALPILSGNVSAFKLSYRSSNYRCDSNSDGTVTWLEIETATSPPCPAGAGTPNSALDSERALIDQIIIDITVLNPPRQQQYRTQVDLRNRN
ncbi:MAG: PilW family protein [Actinomycetota bacterium]